MSLNPVDFTKDQWAALHWFSDFLLAFGSEAPEGKVAAERAVQAILDIVAHATPFGEDEDGFVNGGYLVSVGAIHRALGVVGHTAAPCASCLPPSSARSHQP